MNSVEMSEAYVTITPSANYVESVVNRVTDNIKVVEIQTELDHRVSILSACTAVRNKLIAEGIEVVDVKAMPANNGMVVSYVANS